MRARSASVKPSFLRALLMRAPILSTWTSGAFTRIADSLFFSLSRESGSHPRTFARGISMLMVGSYSPLSHCRIISSSRSSSLASSVVVKPQASRCMRMREFVSVFGVCKNMDPDNLRDMLFAISHASPAHDSISLESVVSWADFAINVMRLPRFFSSSRQSRVVALLWCIG
ncbi:hypothetical protein BvCmsKKP005_03464 [Escherichia coli]|nr:hypothetical protein BvCmsKKP005_03464 [Escherichia coli]